MYDDEIAIINLNLIDLRLERQRTSARTISGMPMMLSDQQSVA